MEEYNNILFIGDSGCMYMNNDTNELSSVKSEREAISRIVLIDKPTKVVVDRNNKKQELYAEPDDLLVIFYDSSYEYTAVVAKSAQWVNNIKSYNKRQEECKRPEGDVSSCDNCGSC